MGAEVISLQEFKEKRDLQSRKFLESKQELEELVNRLFGSLLAEPNAEDPATKPFCQQE